MYSRKLQKNLQAARTQPPVVFIRSVTSKSSVAPNSLPSPELHLLHPHYPPITTSITTRHWRCTSFHLRSFANITIVIDPTKTHHRWTYRKSNHSPRLVADFDANRPHCRRTGCMKSLHCSLDQAPLPIRHRVTRCPFSTLPLHPLISSRTTPHTHLLLASANPPVPYILTLPLHTFNLFAFLSNNLMVLPQIIEHTLSSSGSTRAFCSTTTY